MLRRCFLKASVALVGVSALVWNAAAQSGGFEGKLVLERVSERDFKLVRPFSFRDPLGVRWRVPGGAVVNGASIPRVFWSIIGGPWSGRYAEASVIHDYYCEKQTRPWQDVHRVFYDAMVANGVGTVTAKVMYMAVLRFGPRWESDWLNSARPSNKDLALGPSVQPEFDRAEFERLKAVIESQSPSASDIESLVAQSFKKP